MAGSAALGVAAGLAALMVSSALPSPGTTPPHIDAQHPLVAPAAAPPSQAAEPGT